LLSFPLGGLLSFPLGGLLTPRIAEYTFVIPHSAEASGSKRKQTVLSIANSKTIS